MANYGSDDIVVVMDSTAGTTVNITQSVLEINGIDVEAMLEESHTMGDSWVENLYTGLRKSGEITLRGFFDDDSDTGTDVMWNDPGNTKTSGGATRSLAITLGGTKIYSTEVWIKNYRRLPSRGALTKVECVLTPTGAASES
jgi:hypothetical protein